MCVETTAVFLRENSYFYLGYFALLQVSTIFNRVHAIYIYIYISKHVHVDDFLFLLLVVVVVVVGAGTEIIIAPPFGEGCRPRLGRRMRLWSWSLPPFPGSCSKMLLSFKFLFLFLSGFRYGVELPWSEEVDLVPLLSVVVDAAPAFVLLFFAISLAGSVSA